MGAAASTCGPFKELFLNKVGEAVVISLKALKNSDPEQFSQAIRQVVDRFCKSRGGVDFPLLNEVKEKIKAVIVEHFPDELARMDEQAMQAVADKAVRRVRNEKLRELIELYDANGGTLPSKEDLQAFQDKKKKAAAKTDDAPRKNDGAPVMISFRFGEALPHARVLEKKLEEKGVTTYMCDSDMRGGANMPEEIAGALYQAKTIVLLASETYGIKTGNAIDTNEEMRFACKENKAFVVKIGSASWKEVLTDEKLSKLPKVDWVDPADSMPNEIMTKLCAELEEKGVPLAK